MFNSISILFVASSILFACSILLLGLKNLYGSEWSDKEDDLCVFITIFFAFDFSLLYQQDSLYYFFGLMIAVFLSIDVLCRVFKAYTSVGILFYFCDVLLYLVGMLWGLLFLLSLDVSVSTRFLLALELPLLFLALPFGFMLVVEQFDVLCRKHWNRPKDPLASDRRKRNFRPMVSLHIPTYAEPPEIVIETLDRVAQLRYKNYEVLVIDNNTKDENLWKPIKAHCRKLGRKFRFFHVDPLSGAKAGALNFALEHTSKKAEIIGVIDSDYHTDPDFIQDLIGYFEDPKIGFVQTPHDYRNWEHSSYLTMCYWEYKAFFHTILVALNERDAALTIGTMCLLRKKVIEEAGQWATWCLTEDSELSIRIHDLGYSSIYVAKSYGKGLIPETFGDYTTQRYRWIAGPVQELKYHIRHLLGMSSKPSNFSLGQRVHHLHHGVGSAISGFTLPLIVVSLLLAVSMAMHKEIIPVPYPLWISVTILFVANLFLYWLQYRIILKTSIKHMLMGLLANKALNYVANVAAFSTTMNSAQKWKRTNKFKSEQTFRSSLASTRSPLMIGSFLSLFAITLFIFMPSPGLLTMCLIGIFYKSLDYLAAPVVAIISMKSQTRSDTDVKSGG